MQADPAESTGGSTPEPVAVGSRRTAVRPLGLPAAPPTVTVIIPCFNYAGYLPVAVESVLSQQGVQVDVVIVDDASSDDSVVVARRLAAADSRVQVIAHPVNAGAVQTFNDGLPAVTGEFMVRLDADDVLTPGSLERATRALVAVPTAGLAYGRTIHFTGAVPTRYRARVDRWIVWPGRVWLADRARDALNVITAPEAVMRSSVVRRVGGQRDLAHTHDMEMWMRLAAFADVVYLQGPDQALHREHDRSLSTRQADPLDDPRERRLAFDVLLDGMAGEVVDAERVRRRARRAVALQAVGSAAHAYDRGVVDDDLTQRLTAFALDSDPGVVDTRPWRGLQRRIALGSDGVRRRPWYRVVARYRRVRGILRHLVWRRRGTYDGR